MDNRALNVVNVGKTALGHAVALGFSAHSKAVAFASFTDKKGNPVLVLFWHFEGAEKLFEGAEKLRYKLPAYEIIEDVIMAPLPVALGSEEATDLIWTWLTDNKPAGEKPDTDGSVGRGWAVWHDAWGHCYGSWRAILAVSPVWAVYGK